MLILSVNPREPAACPACALRGAPAVPVLVAWSWRAHGSPRAAAAQDEVAQVSVPARCCHGLGGSSKAGAVLFMEMSEGLEGEHSPCSGNVHGVKAWC